jgi:hypothetical protein
MRRVQGTKSNASALIAKLLKHLKADGMQQRQKNELKTAVAIAIGLAMVCFGAASFAASFIAK